MDYGPSQIGRPGRSGVWTRIRINPVGLTLFPLGFALIFTTFALDAYVAWRYRDSYQRKDFVITQVDAGGQTARGVLVGEGAPFDVAAADARSDASQEVAVLPLRIRDRQTVIAGDYSVKAAVGARVAVWHNPELRNHVNFHLREVVPVQWMPTPPGLRPVLVWIPLALICFWITPRVFRWTVTRTKAIYTETLLDEPRT
jgi:hypothetical protein